MKSANYTIISPNLYKFVKISHFIFEIVKMTLAATFLVRNLSEEGDQKQYFLLP